MMMILLNFLKFIEKIKPVAAFLFLCLYFILSLFPECSFFTHKS
ncbi:hypothetical protein JGUZn3_03690 [Entomobacter blattae]|uniref:Uncharacterized protein n=1 Tax=Entomobacter blattae TaxID=2762277 RepID=A0A7H1NPB0_9PROT|nr:hypothetical protein JGUZn3_03690 [Entomobacter blattae]